ncbi:hypothetical protein Peur_038497 [Populus x canadensis]
MSWDRFWCYQTSIRSRSFGCYQNHGYIACPYDPKSIIKVWMMTLESSFEELNFLVICLTLRSISNEWDDASFQHCKEEGSSPGEGHFLREKDQEKKHGIRKIPNLANPHLPELYENLGS